ncbi:MAG: primosomal protein N', partial [Candidatus Atribacteria bacterium]|nr:primosomal protein N' [Candidatus Atribacteria bacterium]
MDRKNIAEVIPLKMNMNRAFHYLIPAEFEKSADIGKRVRITFNNKKRDGVIVKISQNTDVKNLKVIEEVIDPFPILSLEVLEIADWISTYYLCPKGTILKQIIPSQVSKGKNTSLLDLQINREPILKVRDKEDNQEQAFAKPILFHYHNYNVRDRYYSQWIRHALRQGKQVLILVPDQWCCLEYKQKLLKEYGNLLGCFDKKTSQYQKYLRFASVYREDYKVVIGTRSNIFLPFQNLGLIIIEQEDSLLYKEERIPRYNAKEVALMRGKIGNFQVILGSFAPSIDSYWQIMNHRYILKTERSLTRYNQFFPKIQIVNMEEEKSFQKLVSYPLQQEIIRNLKENKKVILFLNRRGFAGYLVCDKCGYVVRCPECGHILSYHVEGKTQWTVCHTCGKRIKMQKYCPKCKQGKIKPLGAGTQYVENLIRKMFPQKAVQRLDVDIAPKLNDQKKIINEFNGGKVDIFIGTQIIFRELRYHHLGLVGFILADHLLNMPDYRSAEISYQLMLQLALNLSSKNNSKTLLIQTYQPQHYTLVAVKQLDYQL